MSHACKCIPYNSRIRLDGSRNCKTKSIYFITFLHFIHFGDLFSLFSFSSYWFGSIVLPCRLSAFNETPTHQQNLSVLFLWKFVKSYRSNLLTFCCDSGSRFFGRNNQIKDSVFFDGWKSINGNFCIKGGTLIWFVIFFLFYLEYVLLQRLELIWALDRTPLSNWTKCLPSEIVWSIDTPQPIS